MADSNIFLNMTDAAVQYNYNSSNVEQIESLESTEPQTSAKKEFVSLSTIKETGYYFDESGVLRLIRDDSFFPFRSMLIPLFKVRYDLFRALTSKHVREILEQHSVISEILITKQIPNGIRILHTKNFQSYEGPLLVIIQAGGVTRAGVWSSRLLMHSSGGLNIASYIPQIKKALSLNYAILIINPSEKLPSKTIDRDDMSIEEIVHSVWSNLIPKCRSNQVVVWAHMYGGTSMLHALQPSPNIRNIRRNLYSYSPYKVPNISLDNYLTKFVQKQTQNPVKLLSNPNPAVEPEPRHVDSSNNDEEIDLLETSDNNSNATKHTPQIRLARKKKVHKIPSDSVVNTRLLNGNAINWNKNRKRSSIASNIATDNSSVQSDLSTTKYGKVGSNFDNYSGNEEPVKCSSINDSKSELDEYLEGLQSQVNLAWQARRDLFWNSLRQKVVGIVFTDSAIGLKMQGICQPDILDWFKNNSVHYVACVEPLGVELNTNILPIDEIVYKSSGTSEHDLIPHLVTDDVFDYFQDKLNAHHT